jgi:hypothetical protein
MQSGERCAHVLLLFATEPDAYGATPGAAGACALAKLRYCYRSRIVRGTTAHMSALTRPNVIGGSAIAANTLGHLFGRMPQLPMA